MSGAKDGGAAFPLVTATAIYGEGMSLRDWFAGKALAAIIQADGIQFAKDTTPHALWAYEQADAMLAARNKDTTT